MKITTLKELNDWIDGNCHHRLDTFGRRVVKPIKNNLYAVSIIKERSKYTYLKSIESGEITELFKADCDIQYNGLRIYFKDTLESTYPFHYDVVINDSIDGLVVVNNPKVKEKIYIFTTESEANEKFESLI